MNGKKAKELRKQQPRLVSKIVADFYENGQVVVGGVPTDFNQAQELLYRMSHVINNSFLNAALQGKLKNGAVEQPRIVKPPPGVRVN